MWVEIKWLMDFSRLEYRGIKCWSDLQAYEHNVLENLSLQISGFLGNRHFLCLFPSEHSIHICTRFCYLFYHPHHLWLHYCCWQDHSQNSCHNQLEPFILLVQGSMVASQIFRSQSFLRFLTQYQTKIEIR